MHYHLEIVMPPTNDVEAAVAKVMAPFDENVDSGEENASSFRFWDWYQVGGRYSGAKLESLVTPEKRDAFFDELKRIGVTVSAVTFGKQELSPATQIPKVDALWREMCPGAGDVCPLFKHSGDSMTMDVCRVDQLPADLVAYALIVARHQYDGELAAEEMWHKRIWNGVSSQETTFKGNVSDALKEYDEKVKGYREDAQDKYAVKPDWLVVTVDYHS